MSPPPVPDLGSALAAMLRLSWVRLARGRKLRLGIVATLLVVAAAIAARYAAPEEAEPSRVVEAGVRVGFFGLLVYLLPFLFTSGAIAEEVESRTFPFLAMRPAGRFAITLGKCLASAGMTVLVLVAGLVVLHVGSFATEPTPMIDELPALFRWMGALTLLALAYSAICLFWGSVVVEAGGLLSTLHLAVLEFGFSNFPSFFRFVSLNFFAGQLAGLPKGGFFVETVPDVEPWIAGVVVGVATLLFLGLASLVVRTSELGFGKA